MLLPKRLALAVLGAALLIPLPAAGQVAEPVQGPSQSCDNPTDSMTLYAESMSRGRHGFGLTPGHPTTPGPTIEMYEGDCLSVTLVNDTNRPVSLHPHSIAYTPASDGTGINRSCVAPGRSRTYVWHALEQTTRQDGTIAAGSAGYWPYHDHCMGTPHGTLGIETGLYGALIIRRAGDLLPDVPPFIVFMGNNSTIDGRHAPHTPIFRANQGQRVEFVVIGMGNDFHTFHIHGHRWFDTRTGYITDPGRDAPVIDTRVVGPASSFGFQLIAGEDVGPGAWMYHWHVQSHSDMGMVGIFLVRRPDGIETNQERRALARWKKQESEMRMHMAGM
jgi:FtsP/CotA-like multicopper oxidase with cupredoxin domain